MKTNKILIIVLLLTVALSCKNNNEENPKTTEKVEVETEKVTDVIESKTAVVFNANLATEKELTTLGLADEVVAKIIADRPFLSMTDFDALIPLENKEELYQKVFIPFNLNTTAEADFEMIPGVGKRMAHEFEEYRPYKSVKQFEKEIGKYVDETEVARYLNYVFVPVELNTASEEDIKALPGVGSRMAHEFEEYRPYNDMAKFRKEISKYVDDKELKRLERFVYIQKQ